MTSSDNPAPFPSDGERIAKVLARAGVCSRRDAEKLISDGRVTVDGRTLTTPATKVIPGAKIAVDGISVAAAEPTRMWRYHKPQGLVTTHRDPQERPTVFERLPTGLPRVLSVGRLDLNSEGLLLLTNDGELSRRLELPATGWIRRYRVRVYGRVTPDDLTQLSEGVTIEGTHYAPAQATLDRAQGGNAWITIGLKEGKNREVRRLMEHLGFRVNRLIRIAYGPFQLGALEAGAVEEIPARVLRDQLGSVGAPPKPRKKNKPEA